MEHLYGNLYSSLAQLRVSGVLNNASTYVVYCGDDITTVFLFRRIKDRVEVLNEAIRIEEEEIIRFVKYVFASFVSVRIISFRAIQTDLRRMPFTYQRFNYLEDIVAELPQSVEHYTASLGKKTRSNMRRYLKMIKQDFPSFTFSAVENEAADDALIHRIIALSKARMSARNKASPINEEEIDRLINLVKECGLVGIITIDGCVCAGAIICRVGDNCFLRILAHDSAYNKYSLGRLCCYLTISECIVRGAKEFHFLWGRCDYKYLFLGVQRDLDYLAVYRSRIQLLLNADLALKAWVRSSVRQVKLWLHRLQQQDTQKPHFASKVLRYAQSLKRLKIMGGF